jgi:hypothetical protein
MVKAKGRKKGIEQVEKDENMRKKLNSPCRKYSTHIVQRKKIHKNVLEYCFHNYFLVLYTIYYIV